MTNSESSPASPTPGDDTNGNTPRTAYETLPHQPGCDCPTCVVATLKNFSPSSPTPSEPMTQVVDEPHVVNCEPLITKFMEGPVRFFTGLKGRCNCGEDYCGYCQIRNGAEQLICDYDEVAHPPASVPAETLGEQPTAAQMANELRMSMVAFRDMPGWNPAMYTDAVAAVERGASWRVSRAPNDRHNIVSIKRTDDLLLCLPIRDKAFVAQVSVGVREAVVNILSQAGDQIVTESLDELAYLRAEVSRLKNEVNWLYRDGVRQHALRPPADEARREETTP